MEEWRSRPPFSWLPRSVREPQEPVRAILTGYLLTFVGSILLSATVQGILALVGSTAPREVPDFGSGWMMLFGVVVVAPVVETLIMASVLSALLTLVSPSVAIVVSAVGWGIAHSLLAPTWGLVIWWPFLIFSTLFVVWRERGWGTALAVPAGAHALHNLVPALTLHLW